MKEVTDALTAIAATLGVDFLRTKSLTEADIENHNRNSTLDLMVYNGASSISNAFGGAEIIDTIACEIYFLTKAPSKDFNGAELDTMLDITKRYADQTYAVLNGTYAVEDIEPYSLEGVSILADLFIGFRMDIGIPFYNTGC